MVIDSSVLVAILSGEDEAPIFAELISSSSYRLVSTLSFVETSIVIGHRYGKSGLAQLDLLIRENQLPWCRCRFIECAVGYAQSP